MSAMAIWRRSISLALAASLMASPALAGGHKYGSGRDCHRDRDDYYGRVWHGEGRGHGGWYPVSWGPPPQQHHHHNNRVGAGTIALATAVGLGVVGLWSVAAQQADANSRAMVLEPPAGEPLPWQGGAGR